MLFFQNNTTKDNREYTWLCQNCEIIRDFRDNNAWTRRGMSQVHRS